MTPEDLKALIAEARLVVTHYEADDATGDFIDRLADALEAARDWKAQAMTVLSEWEATYEAAGSPGRLGQSKAVALREEIERLRALSAHPADKHPLEAVALAEVHGQDARRLYSVAEVKRLVYPLLNALSAHPAEETVTTVEELDALPTAAVILDRVGRAHQRGMDGYWYLAAGDDGGHDADEYRKALPARVLYRPVPEGSET